jgi:20S proteasome subunit beta 3
LFETISQCLLNACDRDALSGWGAQVTVMYEQLIEYLFLSFISTPTSVTTRTLKSRQD